MIKIAYVSSKYNWSSYSVLRVLYEELCLLADVKLIDTNLTTDDNYDIVIVAGNQSSSMLREKITIRIGFSDSTVYSNDKRLNCNKYYTSSKSISDRENVEYFPVFASDKYFYHKGIKKETDILFLGRKNHPFMKNRGHIIEKLISDGLNIKCYGEGWDQGFISGDELVNEINKSYMLLDVSEKYLSVSSRIVQAAACKVPSITFNRVDVKETLFDYEEKEIMVYNNEYKPLYETLNKCIDEKEKLCVIGEKAYNRFKKNHTAEIRAKKLMGDIKCMISQ